jgi:hypothetical protein
MYGGLFEGYTLRDVDGLMDMRDRRWTSWRGGHARIGIGTVFCER